jgi:hypothetical protein
VTNADGGLPERLPLRVHDEAGSLASFAVEIRSMIATVLDKVDGLIAATDDDTDRPAAHGAARRSTVTDNELADICRWLFKVRRIREARAPARDLFHEPAWDILLDLFVAHAEGKFISVTSASLAGQVPTTTALRWVWSLEKAGLVRRESDSSDRRRHHIKLSDTGLDYMRSTLSEYRDRFPGVMMS